MVQIKKVPWAAWQDPGFLDLKFPDSWNIEEFKMKNWNVNQLSSKGIKDGLKNPIDSPRLSKLAKNKERIVIVVDDMTRTTPASLILPHIIDELQLAGINDDKITILLALGGHKPMNREECIKKLGIGVVNRFKIENHHPYENLTDLGKSSNGTIIKVNSTYYNADLKISLGGVIPHPLAGFGGGAKIVLPGVCGIETLYANHSAVMEGRLTAGIGILTGIRKDIEDIADKIGLDFSINVIFNEAGEITHITSGDFRSSHRKMMEIAREAYSTKISLKNDVLIFNAFPEDSELNQCVKSLNFLMIAPSRFIQREGTIVIMTSSYEGRGFHSLIAETGAKLYQNFGESGLFRAFIKKRDVILFSPNISEADLYHLFPRRVKLCRTWKEVIDSLEQKYEAPLKVGIVPTSIQLVEK